MVAYPTIAPASPVFLRTSIATATATGGAVTITFGQTTINQTGGTGASTSLTVASTTGFLSAGSISVVASGGTLTFSYTGITSTSFTGLTLTTGTSSWTIANGAAVTTNDAGSLPAVGSTLLMGIKLGGGVTLSSIKDGANNSWVGLDYYSQASAASAYIYACNVVNAYTTSSAITLTLSASASTARAVFIGEFTGVSTNKDVTTSYGSSAVATSSLIDQISLLYGSAASSVANPTLTASTTQTIAGVTAFGGQLKTNTTPVTLFPNGTNFSAQVPSATTVSAILTAGTLTVTSATSFASSGALIIPVGTTGYTVLNYTAWDGTSTFSGVTLASGTGVLSSGSIAANANVWQAFRVSAPTSTPTGTATFYYAQLATASPFGFLEPVLISNTGGTAIAFTTNGVIGLDGRVLSSLTTLSFTQGSTTTTNATSITLASVLTSDTLNVASTSTFPSPYSTSYTYVAIATSGGTAILGYDAYSSSSFSQLYLVQGLLSWTIANGASVTQPAFPTADTESYGLIDLGAYGTTSFSYTNSTVSSFTGVAYSASGTLPMPSGRSIEYSNGLTYGSDLVLSFISVGGTTNTFTTPTGFTSIATGEGASFAYNIFPSQGNISIPWSWSPSGNVAATSVSIKASPIGAQSVGLNITESNSYASRASDAQQSSFVTIVENDAAIETATDSPLGGAITATATDVSTTQNVSDSPNAGAINAIATDVSTTQNVSDSPNAATVLIAESNVSSAISTSDSPTGASLVLFTTAVVNTMLVSDNLVGGSIQLVIFPSSPGQPLVTNNTIATAIAVGQVAGVKGGTPSSTASTSALFTSSLSMSAIASIRSTTSGVFAAVSALIGSASTSTSRTSVANAMIAQPTSLSSAGGGVPTGVVSSNENVKNNAVSGLGSSIGSVASKLEQLNNARSISAIDSGSISFVGAFSGKPTASVRSGFTTITAALTLAGLGKPSFAKTTPGTVIGSLLVSYVTSSARAPLIDANAITPIVIGSLEMGIVASDLSTPTVESSLEEVAL